MTERQMVTKSRHFYQSEAKAKARAIRGASLAEFVVRRPESIGIYVGVGRISVDGVPYPFRDTQGINPRLGQKITVRNVGRDAVAIYAPTEGTERQ